MKMTIMMIELAKIMMTILDIRTSIRMQVMMSKLVKQVVAVIASNRW